MGIPLFPMDFSGSWGTGSVLQCGCGMMQPRPLLLLSFRPVEVEMSVTWILPRPFLSLALVGFLGAGCAPSLGDLSLSSGNDEGDDDTVVLDDDTTPPPDDDTTSSQDDDTTPPADDDTTPPPDDDTTPDTSKWDGANLVVLSPHSGDFIPLGEDVHLEAQVISPEGDVLDHDDIQWVTDQDPGWLYVGAEGNVGDFPVGEHVITASTELPNGDRLAFAVGGVLVQHELAGVYSGSFGLSVSYDLNGTPLSASCLGATNFEVDPYGEVLDGDAACTIDLFGFSTEVAFGVGGEIDPEAWSVTGDLAIVILYWELPTEYEGSFSDGPTFSGGFATEIVGLAIEGSLEAERVALTSE